MSVNEIQMFAWGFAISVIGLIASWAFLVIQAFFHDKRIAFTGVFGGALAALAMAVSPRLSHALLYAAGVLCLGFLIWFVARHYKRVAISGATAAWILCAAVAYWCYTQLLGIAA